MRKLLTNPKFFEGLKLWVWLAKFRRWVFARSGHDGAEAWLTTYFQIKRENSTFDKDGLTTCASQWNFALIQLTPSHSKQLEFHCTGRYIEPFTSTEINCNCFKLVSLQHCMSMCFSGWLMPFAIPRSRRRVRSILEPGKVRGELVNVHESTP